MDLLDLFVKVGYDDSDVESGIAGTSKKGKGFASTLGKSFKLAGAGIAAVSAAVVGISTAFVATAKSTAAYGDNIDKLSQKIGLSREGFQKWDFVMSQNGMSIETMQSGMKTLTARFDDAITGSSDAQETFSRLGLSLEDLSGVSQEELFEKSLAALQDVEDQTTRAALASDLFGRSATELAPLLNQSAESTQALMEQAELYGLVMSDEAVDASVAFTDSLDLMQRTFTGLKNRMMAEYLPALTQVTDGLALLFTGDMSGIDQISDGINEIANNLLQALPAIIEVGGSVLSALGDAIIENLPQLIEIAFDILNELVAGLIQALPELTQGAITILTGLVDSILENLPLLLQAALDILIALATGISEQLPTLIPAIIETMIFMIQTLIENLPMLVEAAIQLVLALANGILAALPLLVEMLPELIIAIVNGIIEQLPEILTAAVEIVLALIEGIVGAIPDLVAAIPEIITAIVGALQEAWPEIKEAGVDLIEGLWEGIKSAGEWLWGKIKEFAKGVVDTFKGALGIASPSRVLADQVGKFMALGIGEGITDNIGAIKNAVASTVDAVSGMDINTSARVTGSMVSAGANGVTSGATLGAVNIHFYDKAKTPYQTARVINDTIREALGGYGS